MMNTWRRFAKTHFSTFLTFSAWIQAKITLLIYSKRHLQCENMLVFPLASVLQDFSLGMNTNQNFEIIISIKIKTKCLKLHF